jgi:hypothetical protein
MIQFEHEKPNLSIQRFKLNAQNKNNFLKTKLNVINKYASSPWSTDHIYKYISPKKYQGWKEYQIPRYGNDIREKWDKVKRFNSKSLETNHSKINRYPYPL